MRNIYTLVIALLLTVNSWAQVPQKMSYQAVIRNSSNALVTSTPIGMQISILQGSVSGSVIYSETQAASTNANGLVSIEIGNGTVISGTFAAINWANGPYFIKTETDPTGGTAYTISGTSELLSVPYALHAKTAEAITGGITETDPVFVASPANGITSTSITNWNNKLDTEVDGSVTNEIQTLRISNDTVYLSNGGFAKLPAGFDGNYNSLTNTPTTVSSFSNDAGYLTSFTEVDGSVTNELQTLSISNDTIYLSNGGYTKLPAVFDGNYNSLTNTPTAVSSFSNDAGYLTSFTEVDGSVTNELQTLRISNDTIYLSNGGFAKLPATNAWGLNGNAGTVNGTNFIGTTDNVALNFKVNNQKAGRVEAGSNLFLGYEAGLNYTSGADNTAIGYKSLATTNARSGNTAIGSWALSSNTSDRNTAIGFGTMQNNVSGQWNTAVGSSALITNNSGSHNTAIGGTALQGNISAAANAALGYGALIDHQSGDANTGIGMYALKGNLNGSNNVGLGFESGYNNVSGTGNIFIGYRAGYSETGSNKLYIANSNTTTPLIYGDFTTGNVGIGTTSPTAKLQVETYGFSNKTVWGMNSMLIQNQTPGSRTLLALAPNGSQNADLVIFHNSDYTTNFESLSLGYENTLNNFTIGTSKGGTGTVRRLVLDATGAGTNLWKQLTLATNGNVGIGTLTPGAALEVTGNVKIVDGTQAAGKILTSDATGLATWQAKESKAYGMIYRINAFDIPLVSTWTNLPLDGGESNLINVVHSTTTNPERITVNVSGTYLIQYVIHYRRQTFPHHGVSRIIKNGSNEILGSYTVASPISGDGNEEDPLSTQVITTLTANDYINLQVATNVNLTNEVDSYVGPDLPAPTTKVSVSITIVKIGD